MDTISEMASKDVSGCSVIMLFMSCPPYFITVVYENYGTLTFKELASTTELPNASIERVVSLRRTLIY
jgi:hypothetical protein